MAFLPENSYENKGKLTENNYTYFELLKEIGKFIVTNKEEVVDLLNEFDIQASYDDSINTLINKYANNLSVNPKLMLGTSFYIESKNAKVNFDGESNVNDYLVKKGYYTMRDYYLGADASVLQGIIPQAGGAATSIGAGAASGGVVGTVAAALGEGFKFGSTISAGNQKKKYGAMDLATKREESKNALLMAAMQQKAIQAENQKKKEEDNKKSKKIAFIVIGAVAGAIVLGLIAYVIIKKR